MVDLDELERLEREATPGPWELEERMRGYGIFAGRFQDFGRGPERVHGLNLGHVSDLDANGEDNLALIIAARNALPDLIAEVRTLRARVAELEADRQAGRDRTLGARVREVLEANGTNPERFVSEWCRAQAEYETEEAAR